MVWMQAMGTYRLCNNICCHSDPYMIPTICLSHNDILLIDKIICLQISYTPRIDINQMSDIGI